MVFSSMRQAANKQNSIVAILFFMVTLHSHFSFFMGVLHLVRCLRDIINHDADFFSKAHPITGFVVSSVKALKISESQAFHQTSFEFDSVVDSMILFIAFSFLYAFVLRLIVVFFYVFFPSDAFIWICFKTDISAPRTRATIERVGRVIPRVEFRNLVYLFRCRSRWGAIKPGTTINSIISKHLQEYVPKAYEGMRNFRRHFPSLSLMYQALRKYDRDELAPLPKEDLAHYKEEYFRRRFGDLQPAAFQRLAAAFDRAFENGQFIDGVLVPSFEENRTNLQSSAGLIDLNSSKGFRTSDCLESERCVAAQLWSDIYNGCASFVHYWKVLARSKVKGWNESPSCRIMTCSRLCMRELIMSVAQPINDFLADNHKELAGGIGSSHFNGGAASRCEMLGVGPSEVMTNGGKIETADCVSFDNNKMLQAQKAGESFRRRLVRTCEGFMKKEIHGVSRESRVEQILKVMEFGFNDMISARFAMPDGHIYQKPEGHGGTLSGSNANGPENTTEFDFMDFVTVCVMFKSVIKSDPVVAEFMKSSGVTCGEELYFRQDLMKTIHGGDDYIGRYSNDLMVSNFSLQRRAGLLKEWGISLSSDPCVTGYHDDMSTAVFYATVVRISGNGNPVLVRPCVENLFRLWDAGSDMRHGTNHEIAITKAMLIGHMFNNFYNLTARAIFREIWNSLPSHIEPDWDEMLRRCWWMKNPQLEGIRHFPTDEFISEVYGLKGDVSGVPDFVHKNSSLEPIPVPDYRSKVADPIRNDGSSSYQKFASLCMTSLLMFRTTKRFVGPDDDSFDPSLAPWNRAQGDYLRRSKLRSETQKFTQQQKMATKPFMVPLASAGNAGMKILECLRVLMVEWNSSSRFLMVGCHPGSMVEAVNSASMDDRSPFIKGVSKIHSQDLKRGKIANYKVSDLSNFRPVNRRYMINDARGEFLACIVDVSSENDNDSPLDHWTLISPIVQDILLTSSSSYVIFKMRGADEPVLKSMLLMCQKYHVSFIKPTFSYWWNPEFFVLVDMRNPHKAHSLPSISKLMGRARSFLNGLSSLLAISEMTRNYNGIPSDPSTKMYLNPLQEDESVQKELFDLVIRPCWTRFVPRIWTSRRG